MTPLHNVVESEQREEYLKLVDALKNRAQTNFPTEIADTEQLGFEFIAIAVAVFAAILVFAGKIPGSPIAYALGIYVLYKISLALAGPKK